MIPTPCPRFSTRACARVRMDHDHDASGFIPEYLLQTKAEAIRQTQRLAQQTAFVGCKVGSQRPLVVTTRKARTLEYITAMHLNPLAPNFSYKRTLPVWSPGERAIVSHLQWRPWRGACPIHRQYTSILNLLRRESRAVPVEDQCKLVSG